MRDEERGTRELPAEGARSENEARRTADGIDGIPEQGPAASGGRGLPRGRRPGRRTADRGHPVRPVRAEARGLGKGQRAGR
ncbi:hypothetical protein LV779_00390 [Streptomyces thinghirensis]|nr:hypothetical protein [Streptomyces thinghirensis]